MSFANSSGLAVVTGASTGIGFELAKQFAQHGFDLVAACESEQIGEAAKSLADCGVTVDTVQVDLARFDGVEQLCLTIEKTDRPVDCLVINAGAGIGGVFIGETTLDSELRMIELNCSAAVHLTKRLVPEMVHRSKGHVLMTSSIAQADSGAFEAVYGATKAFVQSFAEGLRAELTDTGVTVTALLPGSTSTGFLHRTGVGSIHVGAGEKDHAAEVARQGYDAMMCGKERVVAGSLRGRMMVNLAHVLPECLTHRKALTGHQ